MRLGLQLAVATAFAFGASLGCGASSQEDVATPSPAPTPAPTPRPEGTEPVRDPSAQLTIYSVLRPKLEHVRTVVSDEPVNDGGDVDVSPLVGETRAAIERGLGAPNACMELPVTDAQGNRMPVAPCESTGDWFYSFYRLPDGWVGGGPELHLQFDEADVCTHAVWRYTQ